MGWGKIDDGLHRSAKWLAATKGARALWTSAMSWCADQGNGGSVPPHMLRFLDGTPAEAKDLVRVGLWEKDGDGYAFHDWDHYNEPAETAEARKARRLAASEEANHIRWHVRRGIRLDTCGLCIGSESDRSTDPISESDLTPPVPDPVPDPMTDDDAHLYGVRRVPNARASDDTEMEFLASEAEKVGIRNLPLVIKVLTGIVPELTPASAVDLTRAITLLASQPVRNVERYIEGVCQRSPEVVLREYDLLSPLIAPELAAVIREAGVA